jgi:hypothetical protein
LHAPTGAADRIVVLHVPKVGVPETAIVAQFMDHSPEIELAIEPDVVGANVAHPCISDLRIREVAEPGKKDRNRIVIRQ